MRSPVTRGVCLTIARIFAGLCLASVVTVIGVWALSHCRLVELGFSVPIQREGHMLYLSQGKGWYDWYLQGAPTFCHSLVIHPKDDVQYLALNTYPATFYLWQVCFVLAIWPAAFWLLRIIQRFRRTQ